MYRIAFISTFNSTHSWDPSSLPPPGPRTSPIPSPQDALRVRPSLPLCCPRSRNGLGGGFEAVPQSSAHTARIDWGGASPEAGEQTPWGGRCGERRRRFAEQKKWITSAVSLQVPPHPPTLPKRAQAQKGAGMYAPSENAYQN